MNLCTGDRELGNEEEDFPDQVGSILVTSFDSIKSSGIPHASLEQVADPSPPDYPALKL